MKRISLKEAQRVDRKRKIKSYGFAKSRKEKIRIVQNMIIVKKIDISLIVMKYSSM